MCRWILYVTIHLYTDWKSFLKTLFGGFWLIVLAPKSHAFVFEADLTIYGQTIRFRFEDISDFGTLWEIFYQEIYRLSFSSTPGCIFDLGSNIGLSAIYFRLKYPDANIYCFEPDPDNFRRLEYNTSNWANVHIFPFAIWFSDGTIDFYVDPHTGNASSCRQRRLRQQKIAVQSRSLVSVVEEFGNDGVDLLKFDVEGAEFEIFEAFHRFDSIHTIVGELHTNESRDLGSFTRLFEDHYDVTCTPMGEHRYSFLATRKEL